MYLEDYGEKIFEGYDYIEYRKHGLPHRNPEEGPARIGRYKDGSIREYYYYVNGLLHRDFKEGPALAWFNLDGKAYVQGYYINGKKIEKVCT